MADCDHSGHRVRLKQRLINDKGFENFAEHNVLELLLFYTIPRKDTNEIAHRILDHFGSLAAVFDAPYEDLIKVKGISENTACLFKAIMPAARAYYDSKYNERYVLNDMSRISEYLLGRYAGYTQEVFSIISLDNCFRAISFDIVAKGGINFVNADVRRTVEILIRTGATTVIIAHNHPGGFAIPSKQDIVNTRIIIEACRNIGIRVMDHILIAGQECVSLRCSKEYASLFDIQGR